MQRISQSNSVEEDREFLAAAQALALGAMGVALVLGLGFAAIFLG